MRAKNQYSRVYKTSRIENRPSLGEISTLFDKRLSFEIKFSQQPLRLLHMQTVPLMAEFAVFLANKLIL
jgi:hypothetical protein